MAKSRAGERTRNWASVFYPESCSPEWQDIITSWHVPVLVSPLHDKDTNATGEPKKPHYHIMIMYASPQPEDRVRELFAQIGAVGCEWVKDARSYGRYLCHLDNPEKAQYEPSDVKEFAGADYQSLIESDADCLQALREMMIWCNENQVYIYKDLVDYAALHNDKWFRALAKSQRENMWKYLRSYQYKLYLEGYQVPEVSEDR